MSLLPGRAARPVAVVAGLFGAAVLAGCAGGEQFRPEHVAAGEAVVYVYRPRAPISPGPITVVFDQRVVARLGPNEYVASVVSPGEHLVRVQRRASATRLVEVGPGESVLLQAGATLLGGRVSLSGPSEEIARDRIANARRATAEPNLGATAPD